MAAGPITLRDFLTEGWAGDPSPSPALVSLIEDVALACAAIARRLARGRTPERPTPQRLRTELAALSADSLGLELTTRRIDAGMPAAAPLVYARGPHLLVFEPLDGAANAEANLTVGSLFSILARDDGAEAQALLRAGTTQLCAGYAVYGPATMLVLATGAGVDGFTLVAETGAFVLTHPALRMPESIGEFAIDTANAAYWEPAVQHYVEECLAGHAGPRGRDFDLRWVDSMVADTHRILSRGGVFLHPEDSRAREEPARLRLLCEANPIALIVERAGGGASTGRGRILEVLPARADSRVGVILGAAVEIDRIEGYHRQRNTREYDAPLFGTRGLFRVPG
jgi:fructose-1,6-bisphosphatase I / sedoheptulose-1,7-bisphosphatase